MHQQKVRSWLGLGTTERLGGAYAELCRLEPSGPLRVSGALWRSLEISEPRRCNERKRLTSIGICRNVGKTEPRHERMTPCKWCRGDPRRSNSASHTYSASPSAAFCSALSAPAPIETCTLRDSCLVTDLPPLPASSHVLCTLDLLCAAHLWHATVLDRVHPLSPAANT